MSLLLGCLSVVTLWGALVVNALSYDVHRRVPVPLIHVTLR